MSTYKKWNQALIDHYFNENKSQEIILYCDEEIINVIGKSKNFGGIKDFVDQVIKEDRRIAIYDSFFNDRTGKLSVDVNKKIRGAKGLKFPILLYEKGIENNVPLTYFSFLIISILKHKLDENKKEQLGLKAIGPNPSGYDYLFSDIQKKYPNFIARRIGKLPYEGLIKFQVVLNRRENDELDEILYKNNLQFSEDESYESILNRVVRYSGGSLREKLQKSVKDECYKIWFENKIKSFDLDKYCIEKNLEKQSKLEGEFALALFLSSDFRGLKLLTNVNPEGFISNGEISIINSPINSRLENGYFLDTVSLNKQVEINEYCFEDKEKNVLIKSLRLNDVILLQQMNDGVYVQTINPYPNEITYVLVKNDTKIIDKFKNWCEENELKIEFIDTSVSNEIIGNSHLVFQSNNFHSPYDKIDKTYLRVDNELLKVTKFGGYRPIGTMNTYLDVALPQFKLSSIKDFDSSNLIVEFIRKDSSVKDKRTFGYNVNQNIVNIFIQETDFNIDTQDVIYLEVNFKYLDDKNIIGSFNFAIEASQSNKLDEEKDFVKLNKWGAVATEEPYYNTKFLKGAEKVVLNNNRHIVKLEENNKEYSDYFINLLCAAFFKAEQNYLEKSKLKEIYESTLTFLRTIQSVSIEENEYSFNNLLKHLTELGYLQKGIKERANGSMDVYLALPPAFSRIEKAFSDGGGQVYLLSGLYSRSFIYHLKSYSEDRGILIRYRKFSDTKSTSAETYLLPDLIFIDTKFNLEDFKRYCEEKNLFFETETKHNVPYSLLNFVGSVDSFEIECLNLKEIDKAYIDADKIRQYSEDLEPPKENEFPRIRVLKTDKLYILKTKFIEFKENEFLKLRTNTPSDWLDVYVKYLRNEPFIVFEKIRSEGNYRYTSELFTYKYTKLPNLISKALTLINLGVPSEHKLFVVNSTLNNKSKEFAFNVFYRFNISNGEERRKQIAKKLTGDEELENNKQIINSTRIEANKVRMELFQPIDKKHLTSFVLIKEGDVTYALIKLGNHSKPVAFYLKTKKPDPSLEIIIDQIPLKMAAVDLNYDCTNTIISNIIKGKEIQYKLLSSAVNVKISLEEYNKENIKIIDNY